MKVLVAGAGGFIGGHLVQQLVKQGHEVTAIDVKPESEWFQKSTNSRFISADLSLLDNCLKYTKNIDCIYNLAAGMGGMGFIEKNKAKCMESVLINTHLLQSAQKNSVPKYFFSSSACVYASWHQNSVNFEPLKESDAYPADPEDGYGWEKLFSERMCRHFQEDYGIETRVARYHNVYGPFGTYYGGREKVPAAACRKIIEAINSKSFEIEIWGDGNQIRSFTFINDCIEGTLKLSESNFSQPLNIGSSESISIRSLYELIIQIAGYSQSDFKFTFDLSAPQGVRGRSSDNKLCKEVLGWEPTTSIQAGLEETFSWISNSIKLK